jgi:hypothetical protein
MLGPRVVRLERDHPWVLLLLLAVAEPVVHLELDPGAGEQVERRRRDELLPGEELAADEAWVRLERVRLRLRVLQGNVPPERLFRLPISGSSRLL